MITLPKDLFPNIVIFSGPGCQNLNITTWGKGTIQSMTAMSGIQAWQFLHLDVYKLPRNLVKMQRPLLKMRPKSAQLLHIPGDIMLLAHSLFFK